MAWLNNILTSREKGAYATKLNLLENKFHGLYFEGVTAKDDFKEMIACFEGLTNRSFVTRVTIAVEKKHYWSSLGESFR
jgi:hypothetical protein